MKKLLIGTILVLFAVSARTQGPTLVQVLDTLYNSNGTKASGRIVISWDPFTAADGETIGGGTLTYTIPATGTNAGVVNISLAPNVGASPTGTSYRTRYFLVNGASYTETWVVPDTGPATISDIRVSIVPSPTVLFDPTTQLYKSTIAQGSLLAGGATAGYLDALAVGANDLCLVADSTQTLGLKWGSCAAGGTGITSLGGQTGATQTFSRVNDTNVTLTIASAANDHGFTVGWTGTLGLARGGTGADFSATGGANQFVKQSTLGGALTVGSIADADVPNTITLDNLTQITTRSHTSLSDIGTNTHAAIDTHVAATAAHGATGAVMGTTNTQAPTNKTLDSGIATTTHAAGANFLQLMRHATDCTAITDGLDGELCYEKDADAIYVCEPTAGGCDTAEEWINTTPAGGGITSLGGQTGATQTFANDTNVTISSATNTHTLGWTGTLAKARIIGTAVYNDQANTWSTGAQDFGAATSLKVPTAAGAAPTVSGLLAYDSTANRLEYGENGVNKTLARTDELATLPLGISDGGTGQTTQTAAFNVLDPLTTRGDVLAHNGTDSIRLALGAAKKVLTSDGTDSLYQFTRVRSHATDCTSLTDGNEGEGCYEQDADTIYVCEPTAGLCDTAAEWRATGGGGGGDSGSVNASAVTDFNLDDATPAAPGNANARGTGRNVLFQSTGESPTDVSAWLPYRDANSSGQVVVETVKETFCGGTTTSTQIGNHGWLSVGGPTLSVLTAIAGHPCVYRVETSTSASADARGIAIGPAGTLDGVTDMADMFDMVFIIRTGATVDSNTIYRCGLFRNTYFAEDPGGNMVAIEKDAADTTWNGVARSGGSESETSTLGTIATSTWYRGRVRRKDASTIAYSVDGGAELDLTTNIPTGGMHFGCRVGNNNSANNRLFDIDYADLIVSGLTR